MTLVLQLGLVPKSEIKFPTQKLTVWWPFCCLAHCRHLQWSYLDASCLPAKSWNGPTGPCAEVQYGTSAWREEKKKKKHNFNPKATLVNDAVNSPLPTGTYLKRTSSQRQRMPVQFAAVWGITYSLLQSGQFFGGNLTAKQWQWCWLPPTASWPSHPKN